MKFKSDYKPPKEDREYFKNEVLNIRYVFWFSSYAFYKINRSKKILRLDYYENGAMEDIGKDINLAKSVGWTVDTSKAKVRDLNLIAITPYPFDPLRPPGPNEKRRYYFYKLIDTEDRIRITKKN